MEMKGLIIGIGAAGNKSVINLVENEVVSIDDVMLINSTTMDVPDEYKSIMQILSGSKKGGFGKERSKSKEAMFNDLRSGKINIKNKVANGSYEFVAVVTSTEGGTGSGAATVLAQYVEQVIKLPVHLIGFTGFLDDVRGPRNTMEFMQDISKNMTVHLIRNDRYFQDGDHSVINAELAANDGLVNRMRVITGQVIRESKQNIDPTDIEKTVNLPGYEIAEYYELEDKIRNKKDFERILAQMCDYSASMQSKGMGRMGVILNLNENSLLYTDDYSVLRNRYGVPYEQFVHRQSEPGKEFIAFICSGMKMPMDEVNEIYEQYQKISGSIDMSEDPFFDWAANAKGNSADSMFDTHKVEINSGDEDAFFASHEVKDSDSKKPATTPASEY